MPSVKVSNVIVPEVFNPYVVQRTAELSTLIKSGIVVPDPVLDKLALAGGKLIDMPFFNDLTGDDEVLTDLAALSLNGIVAAGDQARLHMRGKAWGVNDLAKALSGADPMAVIADMVADYWNRREQDLLVFTLKGVFADNVANDASDLTYNIAGEVVTTDAAKLIGVDAVTEAKTRLGDAAGKLTAIMVHSTVFARLQKLQVVEMIPDAETKVNIPYYLGLRLIVNDGCPFVAGTTSGFKYTSYLFGEGAIGRGEGAAPVPVETDRDSLAGEDILVNRRHFVLHPRGIAWTDTTVAGKAPTNAECALAANWNRVYEKKNIRIVQMITNG